MDLSHQNANRFSNFAGLYDRVRPALPPDARAILRQYLGRNMDTLVDIGCGTGLSTVGWANDAREVIGVEPSLPMMQLAQKRAAGMENIRFTQAFSDQTGLPDACADVATCSQSFHWMNPETTIPEIARILKPDGIFAAFDCDWPPVFLWQAEQAYETLFAALHRMHDTDARTKGRYKHWDKSRHLENLKQSGLFRYAREVLFTQEETVDAERYLGLALSQGDLQSLLESGVELAQKHYDRFEQTVRGLMGARSYPVRFCYRMRLGFK